MTTDPIKTQQRAVEWSELSDEGLRLRCGELTAQEIRSIRAVLASILSPEPTENYPQVEGFDPNNYDRGSAMDGSCFSDVKPGVPLVVMGELATKDGTPIPLGTFGVLTKLVFPSGSHSVEFKVLLEKWGKVTSCATKFGHPKK